MENFPQEFLRHAHAFKQSAWVVADLEDAILRWVRTMGVGPFIVFDNPQFDALFYRGAPASLSMRGAVAQAGDMQIELIEQMCANPSVYRDTVPAGASGFHHMAVHVENFDAELASYERAGIKAAAQGSFGELRFAYMDTSAHLGFMIELIDVDAGTRAFYADVARLSRGWDGARPIRRTDDLHS